MKILKTIILFISIFTVGTISKATYFYIESKHHRFVENCIYEFSIKMDTELEFVSSVDVKFLLSGLEILSMSGSDFDFIQLLTGNATQGTFDGQTYQYINAYQSNGQNLLKGTGINIVNLEARILSGGFQSGAIIFYFYGSGVNGDDSTASVGKNSSSGNSFTQYIDSLRSVSNKIFSINQGNSCFEYPYFVKAFPQGRLITAETPNPNLATQANVWIVDTGNNIVDSGVVETNNFGTGILYLSTFLSGKYDVIFQGLSNLKSRISGFTLTGFEGFMDFTDGNLTRDFGPINNDILHSEITYQNTGPYNIVGNLNIYQVFSTFDVWAGYKFLNANSPGTKNYEGVERKNLSLNIGQTGSLSFELEIMDTQIPNFSTNYNIKFFSGSNEITSFGNIDYTQNDKIISREIVGEIIRDNEINSVDSSVIIQYIISNGSNNSNNEFGKVKEDLNADGTVNIGDIILFGTNLRRQGENR